jgi:glutamate formiminotransferase / 5-formyltetrahydrofolate cyclo-ligase
VLVDVPGSGPSSECVINVSEGRDHNIIAGIARAGGNALLDCHSDAEHHRSVLTLGGTLDEVEAAARSAAAAAVAAIDLTSHRGVHPRLGALDVVPFVPLGKVSPDDERWAGALAARDRFAEWAGSTLGLPCFLYGPERSLPDIRRHAFAAVLPDTGPTTPHPTAGACAVGVRPVLVAYNVWIADDRGADDSAVTVARRLAASLRGPGVRSLGFPLADGAQVSFNLIDPTATSIAALYDAVAAGSKHAGCSVTRAELVGLVPEAVLLAEPRPRWEELDLAEDRTIEFRMARRGSAAGTV